MSTRASIHFHQDGVAYAKVYRYSDGYPEGLGEDLKQFFVEVQNQTSDCRFNDPCYLAAKWVVWDALNHGAATALVRGKEHKPLDFLGVGVIMEDPGDIEYRYILDCEDERPPKVTIYRV